MSTFVRYFLRGGSWLKDIDDACAVYQFNGPPYVRDYDTGFRVVRGGDK